MSGGWVAAIASARTEPQGSRSERRFDALVLLTLAGLGGVVALLWLVLP
jgi:hypothetical protein